MICIIPARGGSRRIPGKNKKDFHGRPIIAYSIMSAQDSDLFTRVIVSTDDPDIAEISKAYGAEVHERSPETAVDEVGTQEVAREVLIDIEIGSGMACVIYPCAPMIDVEDLKAGISVLITRGTPYVYSIDDDGNDAGQFYWGRVEAFREKRSLAKGRRIRVTNAIDINVIEDWERAEQMYEVLK